MDIGKTVVRFALRTIGATGYFIISAIEWEQFQEVLSELENLQGRPFVHERVAILKGFIYGYAEGKTSVLAVWQDCTKSWTWKALGFSKEPSYDTFRRFLANVEPLMDDLLQRTVNQCVEEGIISGGTAAMDTSKLQTIFKNADLDAKWNYDDMEEIYNQLPDCNGLILATPVYNNGVSAQLKAVMDRTRALFAQNPDALKEKVGMGISVGGDRIGGQEMALLQIHSYLILNGAIPVSGGAFGANLGATFWSKDLKEDVEKDNEGFKTLKKSINRFVEAIEKHE